MSSQSSLPSSGSADQRRTPAAIEAVARLYHAYLTGLVLSLVARKGPRLAAELVFRLFRRKQQEQFLPGLEKLGLRDLPAAVACAQYHYLSNQLGGVRVEYMPESEKKAWIRYPPPRWIWAGTAVAGIPSEVSASMLRGWHAHNGVSLENPRLGFVCTKQTVDGQPGLEGYYLEYDRELAEHERLRFARDEEAPPFDPEKAPRVAAESWPRKRLQKAYRNYAMDYVRTALRELVDLFGPHEGAHLGGLTARLVSMHEADELAGLLGIEGRSAADFAELFRLLAESQGDRVEVEIAGRGGTIHLEQLGWRLARGGAGDPAVFSAWNELWAGSLSAFDRFLEWRTVAVDLESPRFVWSIERRAYQA